MDQMSESVKIKTPIALQKKSCQRLFFIKFQHFLKKKDIYIYKVLQIHDIKICSFWSPDGITNTVIKYLLSLRKVANCFGNVIRSHVTTNNCCTQRSANISLRVFCLKKKNKLLNWYLLHLKPNFWCTVWVRLVVQFHVCVFRGKLLQYNQKLVYDASLDLIRPVQTCQEQSRTVQICQSQSI